MHSNGCVFVAVGMYVRVPRCHFGSGRGVGAPRGIPAGGVMEEEEGVYEAVRKVRRLHPRPSRQGVLPAKEVRVTRRVEVVVEGRLRSHPSLRRQDR